METFIPIENCGFDNAIKTNNYAFVDLKVHMQRPVVPRGILTVAELKELARLDKIDTVVVGITDCYGRLLGKRYTADFFLESAVDDGTHACSYLLATDMNMEPVPGYKYANWEAGYGDIHLVPDLKTLRVASWLDKTALVLCDVMEDGSHESAPHAPRSIISKQLQAAKEVGAFVPMAASELEYFLYQEMYEESEDKGYADLKPAGTRGEYFHARQHLEASGVPVENSKGEFGLGQHELNVKYAEILEMADRHVVYKQCLKELADATGVSVTFMAKPDAAQPGSSCHIHLSLWKDGHNIFAGNHALGSTKCSDEFWWFLGGWMKHTPELMVFYAPNVNSYKRYSAGSWAPTQIAWSHDNQTAPFCILDCNVYLAFAAALASGLDGIRNKIEPPPSLEGIIYFAKDLLTVPRSLGEATAAFEGSAFAKQMLGDDVHHHYLHFFRTEELAYLQAVTDWEKARYFKQI
ncbi:hypothetical protein CY35_12G107900 [Sphagnum magellanicum]|nr:hypothetical protein CY35_12G107900 [Sphagnum magellanicum]